MLAPTPAPPPFPVIVKPNAEGSSKGISALSVAAGPDELEQILAEKIEAYKQDMLIEQFIPGREFTVGILGNGADLRVFPPMEIVFNEKAQGIYSFATKQDFQQYVRYVCPPDLAASGIKELEDTAAAVYHILGCRDFARMDFRLSPEGQLYFIELNPLPGLAPGYSDFPILAAMCGMDYSTLIREILNCALRRYG